jgi:tripartite-type tricarboxylate transporter receptor subunit TctC
LFSVSLKENDMKHPSLNRRRSLSALAIASMAAVLLTAPVASEAQESAATYPSKPIRIVIPFPPGGPTDMVARSVGAKLQEKWGQPVIAENRPGGSTIIGVDNVIKSPADGYTLLLGSNSLALNRFLIAKVPYDVDRDIAPIILVSKISNALVVHPSVPVKNLKEFLAYAKANPNKLTYGSTGQGTATHLFAEMFSMMTGVQMVHVPYKGTGPAVIDLLGGQINLMFDSLSTVITNEKAGKVRMIGLTAMERFEAEPQYPTLHEQGVTGYDATGWFGFATRSGVPRDIIDKLNAEIDAIIRTPEMRARLVGIGSNVVGGAPEVFTRHIQSEARKWGEVIQALKITPQ